MPPPPLQPPPAGRRLLAMGPRCIASGGPLPGAPLAPFTRPPPFVPACALQAASGKLWMFGPVNEPISGGLLVWKETSEEDIRAFMQTDPFYTQGVVKSW